MAAISSSPALCSARLLEAFLFESTNLFTEMGNSSSKNSPDSAPALDSSSATLPSPSSPSPAPASDGPSNSSLSSKSNGETKEPDTIERHLMHPQPDVVRKLENMGFYVGQRLVEQHTRHRNLNLDNNHAVMKYLCKDFWQLAFMHTASQLRTNHRGIFVVDDDSFQWLSAIGPVEGCDCKEAALKYLIFPCGVLRGALYSLGVIAVVNGQIDQLPKVRFNVQCNPMVPTRD